MKIAVYAIAKNEAENVPDWLRNLEGADGIFVLDTGSTDKTVELLREGGAHVSVMDGRKPFRFDHARNESMHAVPEDFDVLISLDFDERLSDGWADVIREEMGDNDAANYTLVYSFRDDGTILMSYPRMAIHRRDAGVWQYAAHEVFIPHQEKKLADDVLPFMAVHYGEPKKAGHYLELLQIAQKEAPTDPRPTAYLAREFFAVGNYQMAHMLYQRVLEIEDYPPARMEAALQLARLQTDFKNAEWWFRQAVQYCNNMREPYCELAEFYMRNRMYEHAIAYVKSAHEYEKPNYEAIYRDEFYTETWIHHMLMACYQQMDNLRMAMHHMNLALESCADNVPTNLASDVIVLRRIAEDRFYAHSDSFGGARPQRETVGKETQ